MDHPRRGHALLQPYAAARQAFLDLQPRVEAEVRALLPKGDERLQVYVRDDGAYWFAFDNRHVRMALTATKQVDVLVYDAADVEIRRLRGMIEAPKSLAETIMRALTKNGT